MASAKKHVDESLTLQDAIKKCSERHSCFHRVESVEHISLPPQHLGRLKAGVKEELDNRLMKYSDSLEAVPVGYEGIQILERTGAIMDDSPFIHFNVNVKLVVFKPAIGSKLIGVVNKIGIDHIGCLVHNCFNASISKSNVKSRLAYDSLQIGSDCKFSVIGIETVNGVLAINGRIEDLDRKERKRKHKESKEANHTGISHDWNDFHESLTEVRPERLRVNGVSEVQENTNKKSKKRKKSNHL